jgi:hypothetical protein
MIERLFGWRREAQKNARESRALVMFNSSFAVRVVSQSLVDRLSHTLPQGPSAAHKLPTTSLETPEPASDAAFRSAGGGT